ncbi:hypothetical protein [Adlercreutzia sp. ZJ304]|uniref:hypothetical protein n=1 Tax=Adlercreutzia sp. ZJ304 TaxID=2709791 RepID=UPI0013EDB4FF|nr:hypothetical protein [Adlercreutzia sp. ZJ304]
MSDNKVKNKQPAPHVGRKAQGAGAQSKSHTGKTIAIVVIAVLIVVGIIAGIVYALFFSKDNFYDSNSIVGQAPYKTREEIQAELDRKIEEGMFNISIASVIEFQDGSSSGTAYIENVPGNQYVMQVDIKLDETGETIYESGGLKPDSYIKDIALTRDLDAGTYQATATFHAIDPETLEEQGQAAAKITLNVLN